MPTLNNRSHPSVARLRDARDGRDPRFLFIEGRRLVEEFLSTDGVPREMALTPQAAADPRVAALIDLAQAKRASILFYTPSLMDAVTDLETPPGIVLRADRPALLAPASVGDILLGILLDGIQSPANVGAILRVAEAAGASAVGILPKTADPFSPKSLRGSSGSAFRVPIFSAARVAEAIVRFSPVPKVVLADGTADIPYTQWDWTQPCLLILGGEAQGVTSAARENISATGVRIPMAGSVESLNVAVAAGVLLMEARRQRSGPRPGVPTL